MEVRQSQRIRPEFFAFDQLPYGNVCSDWKQFWEMSSQNSQECTNGQEGAYRVHRLSYIRWRREKNLLAHCKNYNMKMDHRQKDYGRTSWQNHRPEFFVSDPLPYGNAYSRRVNVLSHRHRLNGRYTILCERCRRLLQSLLYWQNTMLTCFSYCEH